MTTLYGVCSVFVERSGTVAVFKGVRSGAGSLSLPVSGQNLPAGRFLVTGQLFAEGDLVCLGVVSATPLNGPCFARLAGCVADGHLAGLPWKMAGQGDFEGQLLAVAAGEAVLAGRDPLTRQFITEDANDSSIVGEGPVDERKNGNGNGTTNSKAGEANSQESVLPLRIQDNSPRTEGVIIRPVSPVVPFPKEPTRVEAFEPTPEPAPAVELKKKEKVEARKAPPPNSSSSSPNAPKTLASKPAKGPPPPSAPHSSSSAKSSPHRGPEPRPPAASKKNEETGSMFDHFSY